MALEFSGFFDSSGGDIRAYSAAKLATAFRALGGTGVQSQEDGLRVRAEGSTMRTLVDPGLGMIKGYCYELKDDGGAKWAAAHPASAASERIDRIVLRLSTESGAIELKLLTGTPGAAPQPPALTRTSVCYEISLCQVRIRAGAAELTQGDITDERGDPAVCGLLISSQLLATLAQKLDAADGAALAAELAGKASTARYTATLAKAGWSDSAPYTQTVTVAGILATDDPFVDVNMSGITTSSAGTALGDAWMLVGRITATEGRLTAYCYEDKPGVDIPILLKVVR